MAELTARQRSERTAHGLLNTELAERLDTMASGPEVYGPEFRAACFREAARRLREVAGAPEPGLPYSLMWAELVRLRVDPDEAYAALNQAERARSSVVTAAPGTELTVRMSGDSLFRLS